MDGSWSLVCGHPSTINRTHTYTHSLDRSIDLSISLSIYRSIDRSIYLSIYLFFLNYYYYHYYYYYYYCCCYHYYKKYCCFCDTIIRGTCGSGNTFSSLPYIVTTNRPEPHHAWTGQASLVLLKQCLSVRRETRESASDIFEIAMQD